MNTKYFVLFAVNGDTNEVFSTNLSVGLIHEERRGSRRPRKIPAPHRDQPRDNSLKSPRVDLITFLYVIHFTWLDNHDHNPRANPANARGTNELRRYSPEASNLVLCFSHKDLLFAYLRQPISIRATQRFNTKSRGRGNTHTESVQGTLRTCFSQFSQVHFCSTSYRVKQES